MWLDTEEGTAGDVDWKQSRSQAPRVDLGAQFEAGYRGRQGRRGGLDAMWTWCKVDLRFQGSIWKHCLSLDNEEGRASDVEWKKSRSEAPRIEFGAQIDFKY